MKSFKSLVFAGFTAAALSLAACGNSGGSDDVAAKAAAMTLKPLIDPNTADMDTLSQISGLTDGSVETILNGRPFASQSALNAALDLDEASQKIAYSQMFIKVGLNSGAEADYMLIPSVLSPKKLAHELDEYRPYENMEQFQRELGKYMDAEALANLSRYVTLD